MNDADLLRQSTYDDRAFTVFYHRHIHRLLNYLRRRVKSQEDAEEIAADVMATAYRLRANFRPTYPTALPWLYAIVDIHMKRYWAGISRLDRQTEKLSLTVPLEDRTVSDVGHAVANTLSLSDFGEWFQDAVRGLRPIEREVLEMVYGVGLTYTETAEALAIPAGTVRSRVNRALRKLRSQMPEHIREMYGRTRIRKSGTWRQPPP